MHQAGPIDLTPLIYVLGGYLALQVLLNLAGRLIMRWRKVTLWQALVLTFWFGVANALLFTAVALVLLALHYAPPPPPALLLSLWWLLAGLPLGIALWYVTVLARKLGMELFGRGEIVAAEDAILRLPPQRVYIAYGIVNLSLLQPLGRELFLRGVLLPAVVADLGWAWALAATVVIEFTLRLNIVWAPMTLVYALAMCGLYYLSGAPWLGLVAAGVAGLLHGVALTAITVRKVEQAPTEAAAGKDAVTNAPAQPAPVGQSGRTTRAGRRPART